MKKCILMVVFGSLTLIALWNLSAPIYEYNWLKAEKQGWHAKAVHDARTIKNYEDARKWLAKNRFHVVYWDRSSAEGFIGHMERSDQPSEDWYIVAGEMQLYQSNLLWSERWLGLSFIFDKHGRFVDVECRTRMFSITRIH